MKIMNKEQFMKQPKGTVYCEFNGFPQGDITIKSDYSVYDGDPWFNGAISLCPSIEEEEYGKYNGIPSDITEYYSYNLNWDESGADIEENEFLAVFSKNEVRRMIDLLVYALCGCEGIPDPSDLISE